MHQRTIITGGAGFIGSHLAERLAAAGRDLVLIDNLSTGRRENVAHLLGSAGPSVQLIEATVTDALRPGVGDALLEGVTQVYHLAASVGVQLIIDDPAGTVRNNIDETTAVLDAAQRAGAAVLVASSSEVYGKCPVLPLREDMDLVFGPTTALRWSYAYTKAIDEQLAIDACRRRGLHASVVRLFNTIGPRQRGRYGMVVPRFVERAAAGEPLEVYGDGAQTRAFCDVRDVVAALEGVLSNPDCAGEVYNVGRDEAVTIRDLADRVNHAAGSDAGVVFMPYERVYGPDFDDPRNRLPDTTKLRDAIGWAPRVPLDDTLAELVALARAGGGFGGVSAAGTAGGLSG